MCSFNNTCFISLQYNKKIKNCYQSFQSILLRSCEQMWKEGESISFIFTDVYILTKVRSLAFIVILAFLCRKFCITISKIISVVHGGYLRYLSNLIGDNHVPSFSGTYFPSLFSPIIIPFYLHFQVKTTSSPLFFHTLVCFILSSPSIFSPVILSHTMFIHHHLSPLFNSNRRYLGFTLYPSKGRR